MKELLVKFLVVILFDSVVSSEPKTKRSLLQDSPWNGSPDYENDELSDSNLWKTFKILPNSLQSSEGLKTLGTVRAGLPFLITKHIFVERPVPEPVIVEKKVAVPVEKIVPVTFERVVNRVVPVLVPHPIPYPVERAVQIPVHQPVAVSVAQPYPVAIRQGVPYPVPVPLLITPESIIPARGTILSGSQNGVSLPRLSPLAINTAVDHSTSGVIPPEGLIDTRDRDLISATKDNLPLYPEPGRGNSLALDLAHSHIFNELRAH